MPDDLIRAALLAANSYTFLHFLWYAFDGFLEWRVRISGTRLAFVTTAKSASEHGDYPNDPRQSTLYCWWMFQAPRIGNLGEQITEIEGKLRDWEKKVIQLMQEDPSDGHGMNLANGLMQINQIQGELSKLSRSVEQAQKVICAARIPVSLKRFDDAFHTLSRSKNLRWLAIEVLFPILFGVFALVLLAKDVWY